MNYYPWLHEDQPPAPILQANNLIRINEQLIPICMFGIFVFSIAKLKTYSRMLPAMSEMHSKSWTPTE